MEEDRRGDPDRTQPIYLTNFRRRTLAPLTFFGRSTIANVETGRQHAGRAFWRRCDEVLGTDGVLAAGYDEIEAMVTRQRDEAVQALQANRPGVIGRGQRDDRPDGGPRWTSDLDQALREAVALWGEEPAVGSGEAIDVAAAREMAFRWLVAPQDSSPARGDSRRRVGQSDVERLRAVRRTLKAADNAHGGGAALPMSVAYLRREVHPLLDGRYDDGTGFALFGVTAELTLDVGWMAYDNADHRLAAHYMGQALRLSHAADDRLFGGRVLAAMSHQALHLGHVRLSVDLVNAARVGTEHIVTPRARAMFAAMEAMAQATDQDPRRFAAALGTAESALAQAGSRDEDPDWLDFDEGGLWGHAARAYRYLNNGEECKRHAQRATALCLDEHGRTRAQRQAILAAGQLRCGDAEQAAATGMRVVAAAWGLTSRHVDQEIVVLARSVQRTRSKSATCTGFLDQAREYLAARTSA
jgi:hypothetical protein